VSARFDTDLSEWWPLFSPPQRIAGLAASRDLDEWGRDVFIATPRQAR
jgi:hypothetical protein